MSNRLFDALACETPVISDDLPEIDELFDGAVLTYRDPAELARSVDAALADPTAGTRACRARARLDHRSSTPSTIAPRNSSTRCGVTRSRLRGRTHELNGGPQSTAG